MPKVSPLQSSFNGGEVSPLVYGRVDSDRYKASLAKCLNYLPTVQGGLIRRPGTYYVGAVKDSTKATRLVRFEYSTTQAYVLEFGNLYVRIYKNQAQLLNGGSAVEVTTTYTEAELFDLKFSQSADVLYITHPSHPPASLTRTATETTWTLVNFGALYGGSSVIGQDRVPYMSENTAAIGSVTVYDPDMTITLSAISAFVAPFSYNATFTASAAIFASTDVGRGIRLFDGNRWFSGRLNTFTSSTAMDGHIYQSTAPSAAITRWRLGVWSNTSGPAASCFHEDRLWFFGAPRAPQRLDATEVGGYSNSFLNFAPTARDGSITDANALSFTLSSNDVQYGRWLISDERGLIAGTAAGEWVIRSSSGQGEGITATNVSAKQATSYGSSKVQPVALGKSTIFVQRSGRKVREMSYFYDVDGFRSPDMTLLAEHITGLGVVQMGVMKEPQPVVWAAREDGTLLAMTFERDMDALKVAWSRHEVGGVGDAAGNKAEVESIAVIPSSDGLQEEVWMVVNRYINGATVRQIEFMTPFFDDETDQQDGFFVDAGLTLDSPVTVTGATAANPVVVTAVAHGFANADQVRLVDVVGMTELNGNNYLVANKTADTFELTNLSGTNIDGTAYTAYVSGGEVRKMVSTISGLSHLEGQSVSIVGDGAVQPNKTVTGGVITLTTKASVVHVGLGYNSDGQMLRLEAGAADGTALGKTRRAHRVGLLLHRSLGLKFGVDFDSLTPIVFRTTAVQHGDPPPLYSGIKSQTMESTYDFENQFCWRQDQPLPSTVLAIMPQMVTQDRG